MVMKKRISIVALLMFIGLLALGRYFHGGSTDSRRLFHSHQQILTNFVQRLMRHPGKCASFCCFRQRDQHVCGGPPQWKMF